MPQLLQDLTYLEADLTSLGDDDNNAAIVTAAIAEITYLRSHIGKYITKTENTVAITFPWKSFEFDDKNRVIKVETHYAD